MKNLRDEHVRSTAHALLPDLRIVQAAITLLPVGVTPVLLCGKLLQGSPACLLANVCLAHMGLLLPQGPHSPPRCCGAAEAIAWSELSHTKSGEEGHGPDLSADIVPRGL